ncbi:MAG: GTPase HflX, partial [Cardiobacteriaceae bacterium]|nr:GTPase HflX [Cardiobacteriaceae bacterium]
MFERPKSGEKAALIQVDIGRPTDPSVRAEFHLLAKSAGAEVVYAQDVVRGQIEPKYFIGKGQAEDIAAAVKENGAELVIFNARLSPSQERNLEKLFNARVLDRSGLVLDIFAQRARSHEGKLQVELAQLNHLATRLVRGWTHLERQKGGIGLRGPGETQLETDRR